MSTSGEMILLQQFITYGDAQAFSKIVRAHAGLVYGVCLRILGDKERAADATQETFFQLFRKAHNIETSIPAWLHRVATRRAVDMIRSDSARRRSEAKYAQRKEQQAQNWEDIAPHVDQALNALDEETRDLLIQYYFENRSMPDIASEKGVSHPTVSRRIEAGRTQLREEFRKKGIIVLAGALGSLLAENAAQAAPAMVVSELAKISLLGTKSITGSASYATRTAVTALAATAKTKLIVAIAVGAVVITGTIVYKSSDSKPMQNESQQPAPSTSSSSTTTQAPQETTMPQQSAQPVAQKPTPARNVQSQPMEYEQPAAVETMASEQPVVTTEQTAKEQPVSKVDLSTPAATVQTFVKMFASGDHEAVLSCFLEGGVDYEDIQEIINADPDDNPSKYGMKIWFESLDPDAEMPVTIKEQGPEGINVVWLVTFKHEFTIQGKVFSPGSQMELDATLVERDGKWLIDNF
jgi:RNA polymerase sigma-70 factor (ECF subfamily)